jgi:hypothetical protein
MSWIENVRPPPPDRYSISFNSLPFFNSPMFAWPGLAQLHRLDAPLGDRTGNLQTPVDLRLRLAHVFVGALLSALALYLDFRNPFMMLFQWFGQRASRD